MPATAKRGFRLPWMRDDAASDAVGTQVLDGRPGDATAPDADPVTDADVEAVDDLGSGPFGIAPPPAPRAMPPLDVAPIDDPGDVLDLEARTAPEPARDRATDGEPEGEMPKWLRQPTAGSSDVAPSAGPDQPEARPGIVVSPTFDPPPSNGSVPHEAAPASAWPEADLAARAAAAQPPARPEPGPGLDTASPESGEPVTADLGSLPDQAEAPRADADAIDEGGHPEPPATEPTASDPAAAPALAEPLATAATPVPHRPTPARVAAAATTQPTAAQAAHDRRDNPLLTGLVRAMRDSARTTREETTARLRAEAETRVTAIRARSAADAVALRAQADEDVVGIREWSKAEMARIRQETVERIEARRGQLATDSHALSSLTGRLVTEIEGAVTLFETEMKGFFKALLAEEDPTQLATLAERMPTPPRLESLPEAVAVGIDHVSSGAKGRASRAAAKPASGDTRATRPPKVKSADGQRSSGARSNRRATSATPAREGDHVAGGAPTVESGALDPEAAALAEAEALAGLDLSAVTGGDWPIAGVAPSSNGTSSHETSEDAADDAADDGPAPEPEATDDAFMIESQTRLIVVGLGDAGVTAFEGALRGVSGVGSVNISPGADGEVVFSVTHGTDTDLRAAVPGLAGFRAHVTGDEGAILSVAAQDPN